MPNRNDTGGFGGPGYGGDAGRPDMNDREARGRGSEDRVFGDPRARREDARLTGELGRFDRARGPRRPDFGHDENYRPGYHAGGTRFGFFGVKEGECLDFFASQDISTNGSTPVSPSGGNIGSGRTRFWLWTDTIQQLQGRAGERQVKIDARLGVCGGFTPHWANFAALSKDPE